VSKILLGRAQPSQTLLPGGGMGKPGFPIFTLEAMPIEIRPLRSYSEYLAC